MASIGPPALGAKGCVERLRPTGETTHYILCVAPLLQNVFAVHRFAQGAADWRSGPRWSILSVLSPVHPFATTWHFPSRGNEKIGGTGYCVTYDTDSKSRNADFISIALRAIRNPQRRSRCRPLSASEHNPSTQPAAPAAPLFFKLRRSRHHNPRPEGPSNLRTFRPQAGQS